LLVSAAAFADDLYKIQLVNHFDADFQIETNEKDAFLNFNVNTLYENEVLPLYLISDKVAYLGFHIDENHPKYLPTEANAFLSIEGGKTEDGTYIVEVHGYIVGTKMAYSWKHTDHQVTITFCTLAAYEKNQGRCE
jgi:hypothetical protein